MSGPGAETEGVRASRLRLALVGCGAMGERVARDVYARSARVEVVAVVDPRIGRASALAGLFGVPAFASLAQADGAGLGIEAVDLRVPHDLHADVCVDALGRGFHVLVEKPLATSAADATQIADAAQRGGLVVAVAENYPHLEAVRAARGAIASGELGALQAIRTTRAFRLDGIWLRDGWRTGGGAASGVLIDQGTHHASLLRQLGGEIVTVAAWASGEERGSAHGRDSVLVSVCFASGVVGQSLFCWATPASDAEAEGVVYATRGRLEVRVAYDLRLGGAYRFDEAQRQGIAISPLEDYYDSHHRIVEDFASAVRDGRAPLVGLPEARADLDVVLGAAQSLAQGGRPVALDELQEGPRPGAPFASSP